MVTISRSLTLVLVLLACASAVAAERPADLVPAQGGEFAVYVSESASIEARRSVTIASDLPSNSAKIAWLVEDGARVEAGDVVARFDAEPFREAAEKANGELQDARAMLLQAESELQIQVRQRKEQLEALDHQADVLELKLQNFDQFDKKLRLTTAENEWQAAKMTHERLELEAKTQKQLLAEGFGSDALVTQAQRELTASANDLRLAEERMHGLVNTELPLERQQMALEIAAKRREHEALEAISLHGLAKQRAVIMGIQSRVAALEASHARALALLEKTELAAPVAGLVNYVPVSVGNTFRRVQVGDSVWSRHGFMTIPDMSSLSATVHVREVDVGKIAPGQSVGMQPEAFPELRLGGEVLRVGGASNDGDGRNRFEVTISVATTDPRLRPGMRARADILVRRFDDVVHVPVETVFNESGESVCYVWNHGRLERRVVSLGESDGKYIVVRHGVEAGEQLTLSPHALLAAG